MSIQAASYKAPGYEAGVGNLTCDIIDYEFTGNESVADPILLRKMSDRNTYIEATIIGSATLTALTAGSIGFVNREGGADELTALGAASVLTAAETNSVVAPVTPGYKHDVCLVPTVLAAAANEVGEKVTIILKFVANS